MSSYYDTGIGSGTFDVSGIERNYDTGATTSGSGFGMNLGTANTIVSGVGSALNFWSMKEQNKINKDTLQFNKDSFNKQFAVAMEDRARKIQNEENIANQYNKINGNNQNSVSSQLERTRGAVDSNGVLQAATQKVAQPTGSN